MTYFLIEPFGNVALPIIPKSEGAGVVAVPSITHFDEHDYDSRNELISDRFKKLMEMYLPKCNFTPVVFLTEDKAKQAIYWKLEIPIFEDCKAQFRNDGKVSQMTSITEKMPIAFVIKSPKGIRSTVVRMAVAESTLRRGILGLKFTKIL